MAASVGSFRSRPPVLRLPERPPRLAGRPTHWKDGPETEGTPTVNAHEEVGDPKRVVLRPGAAGAASFWAPIIERLPTAWHVQAIDLPGLGSVPAQPDVRGYDDLADYVARAIAAPAAVVAQSMGAYVALQLALRHPQLVTHLVLVAATSGVDVAAHGAADWRWNYAAAYPHAPDWARAQVPDLSNRLSRVAVPVLLIWPTRDALRPLSVAQALTLMIPSTSLVTFPSDDHWVVRRFADESAAAIRSFIA
jgi:poly(3-hydroxyoctanoate) depolymerase